MCICHGCRLLRPLASFRKPRALCRLSWAYPVRPAPALRTQAVLLAAFRVVIFCSSPVHRSPRIGLMPPEGPKVRHVVRATRQSLKLAFVLKRGSRPPRPFCRSKISLSADPKSSLSKTSSGTRRQARQAATTLLFWWRWLARLLNLRRRRPIGLLRRWRPIRLRRRPIRLLLRGWRPIRLRRRPIGLLRR